MWLNLSAKNRHRQEGKWETRGSLWVCKHGNWLTSVSPVKHRCHMWMQCRLLASRMQNFTRNFWQKANLFTQLSAQLHLLAWVQRICEDKGMPSETRDGESKPLGMFPVAATNPKKCKGMHSCGLQVVAGKQEFSPETMWRSSYLSLCW